MASVCSQEASLSHDSLTEISTEIDPNHAPHSHVDPTRRATLSHGSLTEISTEIDPNRFPHRRVDPTRRATLSHD
eukprot:2766882-Rhodomonas_salina.1